MDKITTKEELSDYVYKNLGNFFDNKGRGSRICPANREIFKSEEEYEVKAQQYCDIATNPGSDCCDCPQSVVTPTSALKRVIKSGKNNLVFSKNFIESVIQLSRPKDMGLFNSRWYEFRENVSCVVFELSAEELNRLVFNSLTRYIKEKSCL